MVQTNNSEEVKEVKITTTPYLEGKNFYLSVFLLLKQGFRPSKICTQLSISKQSLNYYIASLKRSGFIRKIGYGVWDILKDFEVKEVKITTRVATPQLEEIAKPDQVRAHAFQFVLRLPKIASWGKREEIFRKQGLEFEPLLFGGSNRGQKLNFRGRKVWITDKSIVIYERSSYMAETAKEAKSQAVYDFLSLIRGLESLLGASLTIKRQYQFKVSRQHYALVKNALAKQYDKEGNKLEVYNGAGLWFLIDNSFNLHEAETVHPKTSLGDNEKVQAHFNVIKETPLQLVKEVTPQFLLNTLATQTANLDNYAIHLKSHVESVQKLGSAVEELVKVVKELKK